MKKLLLLFFVSTALHASCPPESLSVEYTSPVTKMKKITCGYMKDGALVKHGPEQELDAEGKPVRTTHYQHGKPTSAPVAEEVKPKQDELTNQAFSVIESLLKVLTFDKEGINEGKFKVYACDSDPKSWVRAALTSTALQKNYGFKEKCDVSGTFVASFYEAFPMKLELRNLEEFNHTSMMVKMMLTQKVSGIRYRFEVKEGLVSSPQKKVTFDAEYEVNIDPLTGKALKNTQSGSMTLLRVNETDIKVTRPLTINP